MAGATIYNLLNILWWNLLGQWMRLVYVKIYTPGFMPGWLLPSFGLSVPQWWLDTWWNRNWWRDNLTNGKPNTAFMVFFRSAAKDRFEDWIENAADRVARPLFNYIGSLLGSLLHGYTTFSNWIESIRNITGTWVPWWTTTLAAGLVYLRLKLPSAIRDATTTWDAIWDAIKAAVKNWAKARFDAAMLWVANTAPWAATWINTLGAWYNLVSTWVTNFKSNPYGAIAGWLGTAWLIWLGVYSDILDFRNEVWVPFKITLHDLLADPTGWLYDRIEDELIRRW